MKSNFLKLLSLLVVALTIATGVSLLQSPVTAAEGSEAVALQVEEIVIYVIQIENISDQVVEQLKKTDAIKYYANEGSKMKVYTDKEFSTKDLESFFRNSGETIQIIDQFTANVDLGKYTKD